jgi:signal transduction histidine kinase
VKSSALGSRRFRLRHWAALDYLAGVVMTVILFASIRTSVRRVGPPQSGPVPVEVHYFLLPPTSLLALVLAVGAGAAVALRRRRPVFTLGVLLVGSLLATVLTGADSHASLAFFLPVAYVLYLVSATYQRWQDAVNVLAAVFATLLADVALLSIGSNATLNPGGPISIALCVIVVWATGYIVRQRRRYAVRLREEAASKAVTQERLRIARELHDVVAHSMSVIAVQAGYGQYVIDTQPGDARAALGAIQATSREALEEMRRMLGALRQADEGDAQDDGAGAEPRAEADAGVGAGAPEGSSASSASSASPASLASRQAAPLSPAPGLGDLDRLLSRTAGAGVQVEVIRRGDVRELPASIDLSGYRIVQEALTNVVKHAQTSSCRVLIGYWDDELVIEVTDNGAGVPAPASAGAGTQVPALAGAGVGAGAGAGTAGSGSAHHGLLGMDRRSLARHVFGTDGGAAPVRGLGGVSIAVPGGGHGIIGMRERVSLLGGEFSAGPLPGYGFRVSARIPLPTGSA